MPQSVNKTQSKWCINKHEASKIIDTFETYLGGVPIFIKEHVNANFQILGTALNLFSMEDNKNPIAIR
jgi:hypothetical protein